MNTKQDEANLILKLYELRRDEALREARIWFAIEFNPQTAQDIINLMRSGHPHSANYRMVTTYWEMAAAFVSFGAIDAHLFHAANTEHMAVFAKIEPFLAEVRAAFGLPQYLAELEKVTTSAPNAEEYFGKIRGLLKHWAEVHQQNKKIEDEESIQ